MSILEIVKYIIISYIAICGAMAVGVVVSVFFKWFADIVA